MHINKTPARKRRDESQRGVTPFIAETHVHIIQRAAPIVQAQQL